MKRYKKFIKSLVKERLISPSEKLGNRLAYMGTGFLMISPYLIPYGDIGGVTYLIGAVFCTPQVWMAKQWNLVALNINLFIGYSIFIWG